MDLFSLGAAGDLGPDAQRIADWVLQSFSLTCSANEWKPQTGAPATHEDSNSQTWYSTDGYPACSPACSPGVGHHSPSGMVPSPTAVLPASGINEGNFASVPLSLAESAVIIRHELVCCSYRRCSKADRLPRSSGYV
jgi:hypothetical protein